MNGLSRTYTGALLLLLPACRTTPHGQIADVACASAVERPDVRALRLALDTVARLAPAWDDYTIRHHPILLVARDSSAPAGATTRPPCVVVWRHGRPPVALQASSEPRYSTPLYGFFNADSLGRRARPGSVDGLQPMRRLPADLVSALRRLRIHRAVVLPVPPDLSRLGAVGAQLARVPGRVTAMQADLAVHEGFHLQAQFPRWFDQSTLYAWPTWDSQPDRAALVRDCYGGAADTVLLRAEHAALVSTYAALWARAEGPARAEALTHLRAYVTSRRARQQRVASVRVAVGSGLVTCAVAEDVMELQEGAAQWIGHSTMVRAGLNTTAALRASYQTAQRERFYQTGAMQLWILEALHGRRAMRRLTASLARASGPGAEGGSIFERLAAEVERPHP